MYCIGILNFTFELYPKKEEKPEVVHTVKLKNQKGEVFYDKLTYIYLEMPNFKLKEWELKTRQDKWLYFINNLEDFEVILDIFKDTIFLDAIEKAKLSNLSEAEMAGYQYSLKTYRDNNATFNYAIETAFDDGQAKGLAAGIAEGKAEGEKENTIKIAKAATQMGLPTEDINRLTRLSIDEIDHL